MRSRTLLDLFFPEIKCRKSARSPFVLYVQSSSLAPVTLYLPSDFCGVIRLPAHTAVAHAAKQKVSFSAGFTNRILPRARLSTLRVLDQEPDECDGHGLDEVEIDAPGPVSLRMWDVCEGAPERVAREAWRRMLQRACAKKNLCGDAKHRSRQRGIDWDFLLED